MSQIQDALELLARNEGLLIHKAGVAANALADAAAATAREQSPVDTLAPLEGAMDEYLATSAALVAYGTDDVGVRGAIVALDGLAARTPFAGQSLRAEILEAVLSRCVFAMTAVALSWHRPDALLRLSSVARTDGYETSISVLTDNSLRHLAIHGGGSAESYTATESWWLARPWRVDLGPLAHDDSAADGLAEAEVLLGCLRAMFDDRVFSAGVSRREKQVAQRIVARLRSPDQRPALCRLFEVSDAQLDATVATAYGKLSTGDGWHRELQLFKR